MADEFVRVRLTRIEDSDLSLFDFDYDLTMMVFLLDAENQVYARYGGRDGRDADNRQSLEGLKYTMQSVLEMHGRKAKRFAPRAETKPLYARDVTGWYGGGCMHCHQVQEAINDKLKSAGEWSCDQIWRYPLPENIGLRLEVDRGNVVERILLGSPASRVGLQPGDVLETLGVVPIHSFADAQLALRRAPSSGALELAWRRGTEHMSATVELPHHWKKSDISWRASLRWRYVPSLPLGGENLDASARQARGLSPRQLAFRQGDRLKTYAREAGFQPGDVIIAIDDMAPEMTSDELRAYVRREYLVGDVVVFTVLREGNRVKIALTLRNQ